ncbi:permease-like cell division protein FtsX [Clostridium swellfunianum]|uniref:permease-like cell division protein FtsX n=1 Tax=Clostridium swellfunianum TaxID=1367462 RepID=UPI002030DE4B|nr:permease-like cell division protein FtsX [Clostridium swellfunianum]MCM0651063.1 permease-like cell division protein FtsX [Clostridium swellfunianum]
MKINTFKHFIGDAAKSLRRNRTFSIASVATVAATLFVLGLFMLTVLNVQQVMKDVESKVEVKVILNDDIKTNEQKDLEKAIKDTAGVVDVELETKEAALNNMKEWFGEDYVSLLDGLDKDTMPTSYIVRVEKPEMVTNVVQNVKGKPGIYAIKDAREFVDKIIAITNVVKWVGIVIFVVLIGVSLFLIGNTIKLTVYARRREIGIMKYIGATDWFIRWPFVLEGAFIGIFGAIVADLLLYFGYKFVFEKMSVQIFMINLVNPSYVISTIIGQFLLGGIAIGVLGSIMAIRKFLAV